MTLRYEVRGVSKCFYRTVTHAMLTEVSLASGREFSEGAWDEALHWMGAGNSVHRFSHLTPEEGHRVQLVYNALIGRSGVLGLRMIRVE